MKIHFRSSILIIYPIPPSWIIEIYHAFWTGELAASTLDTSLIIMFYLSIFNGKPVRRTEIKACFFIALAAYTGIYFDMPFLVNLKANKPEPLFNTNIHNALKPFITSSIIFLLLPLVPSKSSSNARFFAPSTAQSL